ncbi:GTP-dependent dephospho-CoA kinase family protein [Methanoregula sp. UBA64]|jgi:GTP-dependent dephospho-CoA kinase|uniref:GTP-dependent dephospho-CoA kinase family protein n=1 Tax=Methanoregula sp. UBA64 TaxID=1915554 RepID=UPI0025E9A83C|nr:GTP-dependent dephospho-CoA kinase family protein [Methanoregula sp. UBA64]
MFVLPDESRRLFKDPFGTLYPEIEAALPSLAGRTIYAVGDVVTHNLQKNGIVPAIAVIDGQTMRSPCDRLPEVKGTCIRVKNPPGTITDELIQALYDALAHPPATILVDGEEDLAVIPLVIAAPDSSVLLYGQPREGVVLRTIDAAAKTAAISLLAQFTRVD